MKKIIVLLLLFIFTLSVKSQPDLKFVRYTTQQSPANDDILSICQDHLGFIWFGTKDGCGRFDGMEFKFYQFNDNDSGPTDQGWVNKIVRDKENRLWFAIAGGEKTCLWYDYEHDRFVDVSKKIKEQINSKEEIFNFWTIFADSQGLIWIQPSGARLMCFNPNTNFIKTFPKMDFDFSVQGFFEDMNNNIWISTLQGMVQYDRKQDSFKFFMNKLNDDSNKNTDRCNCAYQDSEDEIWAGTSNGLNRIVIQSGHFVSSERFTHDPLNEYSISNDRVLDIEKYDQHHLLIATINGLCLLNRETMQFYRYLNDELDNESINSNLVRDIYKDKHDNIWIATNFGVGKIHNKKIRSYSHSSYKNSISYNKVQGLCEGPDSSIWIATAKGIDIFDRKTRKFHFKAGITRDSKGLFESPLCIHQEKGKAMWLGTLNGGFSCYDYFTKKFTNYNTSTESKGTVSVFVIFADTRGNLWISDNGVGVYAWNQRTSKKVFFSPEPNNEYSLNSNKVVSILEDSKGHMWFGSMHGLNVLTDFENKIFKRYLDGIQINCMTDGNDSCLWVGAKGGLYRVDKRSGAYDKFTDDDGLPGNDILGIVKEAGHALWLSTNNGIARFIWLGNSIPEVIMLQKSNGLDIGTGVARSYAKLSDGSIAFGGNKGFCLFHPSKIKKDRLKPSIMIIDFKVGDRTVGVGEEINGQVILNKSISQTEQLVLKHKNREFTIEFAALQYNMPQHNKYAYRLEGHDALDNNWHYTDAADRKAKYMNLSGGDYIFKVKAANSSGVWNNQPATLKIKILRPFWATWWFRILTIALIISIIIVFYYYRIRVLNRQKQILEQKVEDRTQQLKEMNFILKEGKEELEIQASQMIEMNNELLSTNAVLELKNKEIEKMAEKIHESDQVKLRFFANISHEFRTPLTLIISPLEKWLSTKQQNGVISVKANYVQLIHRNAKRLLRLVNEILNFRQIDQGSKKLHASSNNIIEFMKEVVDVFAVQAEAKKIQMSFIIDHFPLNNNDKWSMNNEKCKMINDFWFDPDIMEKILYNLISNAIKYTMEGGGILIALGVAAETRRALSLPNNQLAIKISDTGIGIKPENIDRIFERFYRAESVNEYKIEGTGIGLAYTKELVKLHNGTITIKSEPNKGTTISLLFPIINYGHENQQKENESDQSKNNQKFNLPYLHSMIEDEKSIATDSNVFDDKDQLIFSNQAKENKRKYSILIIEDNKDLRDFIQNEFSGEYIVLGAKNGEEGLEIAIAKYPDLIISDIMMPLMDGIELCRRLKNDENTCHIPILLLTAKSGEESELRGLKSGADDYITKPFNINILQTKVRNILVAREQLQKKFSLSIDISPKELTHSVFDEQFLQKAVETVNENLHDYRFDNDAFVQSLNYSRATIYRKIKSITNQSVSEFIRTIRLKAAAKLFLDGNDNVAQVCYQVGFKHQTFFTQHFKKVFGKTPTQFIKDNWSDER